MDLRDLHPELDDFFDEVPSVDCSSVGSLEFAEMLPILDQRAIAVEELHLKWVLEKRAKFNALSDKEYEQLLARVNADRAPSCPPSSPQGVDPKPNSPAAAGPFAQAQTEDDLYDFEHAFDKELSPVTMLSISMDDLNATEEHAPIPPKE